QHAGRTGRETLSIAAETIGVDSELVEQMLDRVGLERSAARKRVGNYSLGMRQRLGIAQVRLGDPKAPILGAPAHGLDPEGIIWMRGLLRDFADRGGSVLLSSHLLHEVEAIADRLVLINRGRIVAQGDKSAMLASSGTLVRGPDRATLERALSSAGIELHRSNGAAIADAEPARVGAVAVEAHVQLSELRAAQDGGLEELFLSLTTDQKEMDG